MKALVIATGNSVVKNIRILDTVRQITQYDPELLLFPADRALKICLAAKLPAERMITATVEETGISEETANLFKNYYTNIPGETASKIRVHLSCLVDDGFVNFITQKGYRKEQDFHRLLWLCRRKVDKNLPIIRDGLNVGMALVSIASIMYGIREIATLGIDLQSGCYDSSIKWDGELEQSAIALLKLQENGTQVYNCNPNRQGRFYMPLQSSTLREFASL